MWWIHYWHGALVDYFDDEDDFVGDAGDDDIGDGGDDVADQYLFPRQVHEPGKTTEGREVFPQTKTTVNVNRSCGILA